MVLGPSPGLDNKPLSATLMSVGCDLPNYDFYGDQKLFAALSKFRLFIRGWGRDVVEPYRVKYQK